MTCKRVGEPLHLWVWHGATTRQLAANTRVSLSYIVQIHCKKL